MASFRRGTIDLKPSVKEVGKTRTVLTWTETSGEVVITAASTTEMDLDMEEPTVKDKVCEGEEDDGSLDKVKIAKKIKTETSTELEQKENIKSLDFDSTEIGKNNFNANARTVRQLLKILRHYFRNAFTILVKRRRLAPSDVFKVVESNVFGIKLPEFVHPSLFEYVDEIAQKMITLLIRNVTGGCVMHVILDKNKTSHVIQRFVFRTVGALDFQNPCKREGFNLEDARNVCRASLLQILSQPDILPILIPQYSRWSISVGIKEEFKAIVDEDWIQELWNSDESYDHFPWKQRPRNPLAPPPIPVGEGVSVKLEPDQDEAKVFTFPKRTKNVKTMKKLLGTTNSTPTMDLDSFDVDDDANYVNTVCIPISSFPVTSDFMISMYVLEYPAPSPGPIIKSVPSGPAAYLRHSRHRRFFK